ncbi:MAG: hypothetical protein ACK40O_02600 [Allosphingosinicella sp.]
MNGKGDSGGRRQVIGAEAKEVFLAAVKLGVSLEGAAGAAGFTIDGLYGARRRDAGFRAAWEEALAYSAARERARGHFGVEQACPLCGLSAGGDVPATVTPNNQRRLQLRRMRHARFDDARKDIFLSHLAGTADTDAAAAAAGVHRSTAYKHRLRDSRFAARFDEALAWGYMALEEEALRQRLAAQARARREIVPAGEVSTEFERTMALLKRWDRRGGRIGMRAVSHGRARVWTFEEAIRLLDKKLRAMGARTGPPLPESPDDDG